MRFSAQTRRWTGGTGPDSLWAPPRPLGGSFLSLSARAVAALVLCHFRLRKPPAAAEPAAPVASSLSAQALSLGDNPLSQRPSSGRAKTCLRPAGQSAAGTRAGGSLGRSAQPGGPGSLRPPLSLGRRIGRGYAGRADSLQDLRRQQQERPRAPTARPGPRVNRGGRGRDTSAPPLLQAQPDQPAAPQSRWPACRVRLGRGGVGDSRRGTVARLWPGPLSPTRLIRNPRISPSPRPATPRPRLQGTRALARTHTRLRAPAGPIPAGARGPRASPLRIGLRSPPPPPRTHARAVCTHTNSWAGEATPHSLSGDAHRATSHPSPLHAAPPSLFTPAPPPHHNTNPENSAKPNS